MSWFVLLVLILAGFGRHIPSDLAQVGPMFKLWLSLEIYGKIECSSRKNYSVLPSMRIKN